MGVTAGSLDKRPDGSIAWPEGIVGALSHSDIWCAAAVARRSEAAGIGLDIETIARIGEKLWRRILTGEERSWIAGQPAGERQRWAALMFSAKEALYKCIAARVKQRMGFMDAVIVPGLPSQSFAVRLNEPVAAQLPPGLNLRGRFFFCDGSVFSGLVLAALLFGTLRAGATRMQSVAQIPIDIISILQAMIIIFIACKIEMMSMGICATDCMRVAPARSVPKSSAASTTPTGCLRPSSASAIESKP